MQGCEEGACARAEARCAGLYWRAISLLCLGQPGSVPCRHMPFKVEYVRKAVAFQRELRDTCTWSVCAVNDHGLVAGDGQFVCAGKGQPEGHMNGAGDMAFPELGRRSNVDNCRRVSLCDECRELLASDVRILRIDGLTGDHRTQCDQ